MNTDDQRMPLVQLLLPMPVMALQMVTDGLHKLLNGHLLPHYLLLQGCLDVAACCAVEGSTIYSTTTRMLCARGAKSVPSRSLVLDPLPATRYASRTPTKAAAAATGIITYAS
jgi:hypothetical protein